ncbi:unnamed protein product [Closterium sp. Naga37s-1]|nr:unnamed protein product [Closterium sp. Naga37s-1]
MSCNLSLSPVSPIPLIFRRTSFLALARSPLSLPPSPHALPSCPHAALIFSLTLLPLISVPTHLHPLVTHSSSPLDSTIISPTPPILLHSPSFPLSRTRHLPTHSLLTYLPRSPIISLATPPVIPHLPHVPSPFHPLLLPFPFFFVPPPKSPPSPTELTPPLTSPPAQPSSLPSPLTTASAHA